MSQPTSTFKPGDPSLHDLLKDISIGKIQLPDFQRGWVWDDSHIKSLLASVSLSYPIGSVMLLQTGGEGARFQPRPVEGVSTSNSSPDLLILDGQQRMTSLYLSMFSGKPVPTKTEKDKPIERIYYLDMRKCLDPSEERIEAVLSIPSNGKVTEDFGKTVVLDVSSREKEFENLLFPVSAILNFDKQSTWRRELRKFYPDDDSKIDLYDKFEEAIINRINRYRVPTIELLKETPKEAVCQVFEKVNTGGVTLTVFELVTAIFASSGFNLRKDWEVRQQFLAETEVLKEVDATTFLTSITLLATYERNQKNPNEPVRCTRKDVLKLELEEYRRLSDGIQDGLVKAAMFLAREKVFDTKMLPYTTQLIPLACICHLLGNDLDRDTTKKRLSQWYWCGVFGELYGGANESRFAFDVPEVLRWIRTDELPRTIRDASFSPTRLLSMQSRLSAAYKGLMALLMKSGSNDFISGDSIEINSYFDQSIDIHHIFPRDYCENLNLKKLLWNSAANKAPLTAKSNRSIGKKAPSVYLASIERNQKMDPARLDEILNTHQVNPKLLRSDNFDAFIRDRASRLLHLIEAAMGKNISGWDSEEVIQEFGDKLSRMTESAKA